MSPQDVHFRAVPVPRGIHRVTNHTWKLGARGRVLKQINQSDGLFTARLRVRVHQTAVLFGLWLVKTFSFLQCFCELLTSTLTAYSTPYTTLVHQGKGTKYPR